MVKLGNGKYFEYEYNEVEELPANAQNFIQIPSSVILDTEMGVKRVALYSYLYINKGLNNKLIFSIPKFLEWAGYKSDCHKGAINESVLDTAIFLSHEGYLYCIDSLSKSSFCEVRFDSQYVYDLCHTESFAILYLDEIEKIMKYRNSNPKDCYLNNFSILLVFAFLRHAIFRTPNSLKPEERSEEGIKKRRERCIEAYNSTFKEIAEELGLSERVVSRAVKILVELELIVVAEAYHIKLDSGEYRTPYVLFANMEKREGKYLLNRGLNYAHDELQRKADLINKKSIHKYILKPFEGAA